MIAVPTIATIRDQIIGDIEGKIGTTTPILAKAFVRILATALAGVMALAYRFGAWTYRQIFPQTADEEALVRIGESYGLARTAAVAAVLTATATGDDGTIVPAETLWLYGDQVYRQTTASTVSSGSAAITLEALTAGDAGNLANGTELSISSPLSGMDGTATVASTVTTGEDAEDIEDYRTRVIDREARPPIMLSGRGKSPESSRRSPTEPPPDGSRCIRSSLSSRTGSRMRRSSPRSRHTSTMSAGGP
jgi:uncharacterized phage protein gp47/JayE